MANAFLTDDMITLEALDIFTNSLAAANHCDRKFEGLFGQKDGLSNTSSSIRIRKPILLSLHLRCLYRCRVLATRSFVHR